MGWQDKLNQNFCTIKDLKQYIEIGSGEEEQLQKVIDMHPMYITRYYMSLINPDDKDDPIRKLIVPSVEELDASGSYDTSGEQENTKAVGLQHKYDQTALVLSTSSCSAYCRFCFRKRLVGLKSSEILSRFNDAVDYIKEHKEINNVLISGGDPFVLPTELLEEFLDKISAIPHVRAIRFGSRVPVTFPDRILDDSSILDVLKKYSVKDKRVYVVTHFNHPREFTEKSINVIDALIKSSVIVNNQVPLLRGINDKPEILAELLNKLVSIGIANYYVFQCRPVKRVKGYFQVSLRDGYDIVENAKKMTSGLGKRFRYIMSHKTGKIEIVGIMGEEIYFKYHQAKNKEDIGRFFKRKLVDGAAWLDDLE